jgi:hypothetical protein
MFREKSKLAKIAIASSGGPQNGEKSIKAGGKFGATKIFSGFKSP